ncbi:hypothetical protein Suden_1786 [Sulfurimonas denitrificans DSM 1251]|uniref:DUF4476 domain-containing protein n=1 Tax=Sulfurimonas denitrificans (strain ATCC 33889 / DSM 1251) TaxID=326298 RepID=Q30PM1_SULDN|nr:hypothetical protein [Sulfurimonas denitrificans]ABB45060.1 hypothetical protein Suden_1786 [Sulfurimonas denitrificans DSM 1251]MDD3442181.1 hypothetical protein [Sulfurimonas denitrificans]
MNKRILIITVFLSNVVFATLTPLPPTQSSLKNSTINSLSNMATLNLYNRGLDKAVAKKKISDSLRGDENSNDLMMQNILNQLDVLSREDLVKFVSDAALHSRDVDLSSYGTLLCMVQKNSKTTLDKTVLEKLQKIALENQNIRSL